MRRAFLIGVGFIVAACGSKKDADGDKGAAPGERVEKSADLSTLFSGTTVTLPEEIALRSTINSNALAMTRGQLSAPQELRAE